VYHVGRHTHLPWRYIPKSSKRSPMALIGDATVQHTSTADTHSGYTVTRLELGRGCNSQKHSRTVLRFFRLW
jgi:hypothetical protein